MTIKDAAGSLSKLLGILIPIVAVVAVLNIPMYFTGESPFNEQYEALYWMLVVSLCFLTRPFTKKSIGPSWLDFLFMALALLVGLFVVVNYYQIQLTLGMATPVRVFLGVIAVFILLESTRRVAGWPIVIIILVFIVYAKFGDYFPGLLQTKPMSWKRLFAFLYLSGDAWLGVPSRVVLMIVFGFLLMGRIFFETGGGSAIIGFAEALMGRFKGGPAKVAVLASSLFGAMSGSTVGNVASTGMVTIPMMKKTGFRPEYAAAVEVVASNGGQILPPVMGAAAFIMAEFLGVSYPTVVLAAIVPGLLYYMAVFLQIHLRAVSSGLKPMPIEERPDFKEIIRKGWIFAIPLAFLCYALFILWLPPGNAALYTAGITVLVTLLKRETRKAWTWETVMAILQKTSRTTIEVTAISAAAGLVVGIVSYTGLGLTFSRVLTNLAGGNLFFLAVLAAAASTCLGMGMPPAPAYILLAVLAAPALSDMGVPAVTAHMFVYYFGILSMVTPPVCIAVYTGASIAEARMMPCAFHSMKLSVGAYIVPFIMLYTPALNFIGSPLEIILACLTTAVGIGLFSIVLEGYLLRKISWFERFLFTIAGLGIIITNWTGRLIGVGILAVALLIYIGPTLKKRRTQKAVN